MVSKALFVCQECGKEFRSVNSAEKAQWDGCPVCSSTPVKIPSDRQEMMSIYLRDEIGD